MLSVVVTVLNEQDAVEELYRRTAAALDGTPFELLFVDVGSGRRVAGRDSPARTVPSRVLNGLLRRFTGVPISDFGCAFNAYRRGAIEPLYGAIGKQKFTKALVLASGASVEEVDVSHSAASNGSRYSPFRL